LGKPKPKAVADDLNGRVTGSQVGIEAFGLASRYFDAPDPESVPTLTPAHERQ